MKILFDFPLFSFRGHPRIVEKNVQLKDYIFENLVLN